MIIYYELRRTIQTTLKRTHFTTTLNDSHDNSMEQKATNTTRLYFQNENGLFHFDSNKLEDVG